MQNPPQDTQSSLQRVRVGLTGLASVLLLIGVASAIFSSAREEEPVVAEGAPKADVVANMTEGLVVNSGAGAADEPIAELGIAPRTAESPASGAMPPATPK